jgi:hypothetical protein
MFVMVARDIHRYANNYEFEIMKDYQLRPFTLTNEESDRSAIPDSRDVPSATAA